MHKNAPPVFIARAANDEELANVFILYKTALKHLHIDFAPLLVRYLPAKPHYLPEIMLWPTKRTIKRASAHSSPKALFGAGSAPKSTSRNKVLMTS